MRCSGDRVLDILEIPINSWVCTLHQPVSEEGFIIFLRLCSALKEYNNTKKYISSSGINSFDCSFSLSVVCAAYSSALTFVVALYTKHQQDQLKQQVQRKRKYKRTGLLFLAVNPYSWERIDGALQMDQAALAQLLSSIE